VVTAPQEKAGEEILGGVVLGIGEGATTAGAAVALLEGEPPGGGELVVKAVVDCGGWDAECPEIGVGGQLLIGGVACVELEGEEAIEEGADLLRERWASGAVGPE